VRVAVDPSARSFLRPSIRRDQADILRAGFGGLPPLEVHASAGRGEAVASEWRVRFEFRKRHHQGLSGAGIPVSDARSVMPAAICLTAGAAVGAAAASFACGSRTGLAGLAAEFLSPDAFAILGARFHWGEAEAVPRQPFLYSHHLHRLKQEWPLRAHSRLGCSRPARRSLEPLALVSAEQAALQGDWRGWLELRG